MADNTPLPMTEASQNAMKWLAERRNQQAEQQPQQLPHLGRKPPENKTPPAVPATKP